MSTPIAHALRKKWRSTDVRLDEKYTFNMLVHNKKILAGLKSTGFRRPSPVQVLVVPTASSGRNLIVQSKSGTGKTCLFVIRALECVNESKNDLQVVIIAPTREIAAQVQEVVISIGRYVSMNCEMFIGGLPVIDDINKLENCQIAVGTPGRLAHMIDSGYMYTDSVKLIVLDEADHLMSMNFAKEINCIMDAVPKTKQILAVSATFREDVVSTFQKYMADVKVMRVYDDELALKGVVQFFHVMESDDYDTTYKKKFDMMLNILKNVSYSQCMVFSSSMSEVEKLCWDFKRNGHAVASMSGDDNQETRLETVAMLKGSKIKILVTTNVTARGIDVENVNLVLNTDPSRSMEVYMHRVGRAGRYGSRGACVTLVTPGMEIQRLLRYKLKAEFAIYPLPDPIPYHLKKYQPPTPELGDAILKYEMKSIDFADSKMDMEDENLEDLINLPCEGETVIQDLDNQGGDCTTEHSELPKTSVASDCNAVAGPLTEEQITNHLVCENIKEGPLNLSVLDSKMEPDTMNERPDTLNPNEEELAINSKKSIDCNKESEDVKLHDNPLLDCDEQEVSSISHVEDNDSTCVNSNGVENAEKKVEYELFHLNQGQSRSSEVHTDNSTPCETVESPETNVIDAISELSELPKSEDNDFGFDAFCFDFGLDPVEENNLAEPSSEVSFNCAPAKADGEMLGKDNLSGGTPEVLVEGSEDLTMLAGKKDLAACHDDGKHLNVDDIHSKVIPAKEVDPTSNISEPTKTVDSNVGEQNSEKYNENCNTSATSGLKKKPKASAKGGSKNQSNVRARGKQAGICDKSQGCSDFKRLTEEFRSIELKEKKQKCQQPKSATVVRKSNPQEVHKNETTQVLKAPKTPARNKNLIASYPQQKSLKGENRSKSKDKKEELKVAVPEQRRSSERKTNKCGANKLPANKMAKEHKPLKMEHNLNDCRHSSIPKEARGAASTSGTRRKTPRRNENEIDPEDHDTCTHRHPNVATARDRGTRSHHRLNETCTHRHPNVATARDRGTHSHHRLNETSIHHSKCNHYRFNSSSSFHSQGNDSYHHHYGASRRSTGVCHHDDTHFCRSHASSMIQPRICGSHRHHHHNRSTAYRSSPAPLPPFPFFDQSFDEDFDYGAMLHEALLLSLSLR